MKLSNKLTAEIEALNEVEPNVSMFIDSQSIFWVTKDGEYVWIASHSGIDHYIDADHKKEEINNLPEGVESEGVYWMNGDFENPFHVSDFTNQIETINI